MLYQILLYALIYRNPFYFLSIISIFVRIGCQGETKGYELGIGDPNQKLMRVERQALPR